MPQNTGSKALNGRYALITRIGSGGFGETWLAEDELLKMPVAVKMFLSADEQRRERYLDEAQNLAKFWAEPGIVSVRDYFEDGDRFCLVMEYLQGENLGVYLYRTGKLSLQQTLDLLRPVMQTVQKLHDAEVIHRDISPDNLYVLPNGQVKLLDFGSALSTNSLQAGQTVTVKPGYAPPEQYGDVSTQGPWTDVYSLAATIWQCLTGRKPMDSLQRTFHDELVAPSQLGAQIDADAEAVLMRALSLDPKQRVRSVSELLSGLEGQKTAAMRPIVLDDLPPEQSAAAVDAASTMPIGSRRQFQQEPYDPASRSAQPESYSENAPVYPSSEPEQQETMQPGRNEEGVPAQEKQDKREKQSAQGGKREKGSKLPIIAAIAAVLVVVLVIASNGGGINSNPYRGSSSSMSTIENTAVTSDALDTISKDKHTDTLFLNRCQLDDDDISRIAEMDNIESLKIRECVGFTTLDPLSKNPTLSSIDITGYDGFDGSAMIAREYPNLTSLSFDTVRFEGGSEFLNNFPNLEELSIAPQEGISDIDYLKSCPKLRKLTLVGTDLSGEAWQPLANCTNLETVILNGCNLSTLEWAAQCPNLVEVRAINNSVSSLAGLENHESLQHLILNDNQVSDLTALSSCPSLRVVSLPNNDLSSLDGLQGHDYIHGVLVSGNHIDDAGAAPLVECSSLESLSVGNNKLTKVDFCERMISLQDFDASDNQITDLGKLGNCSSLKHLYLQRNQLSNIDALGNDFTELEILNISFNQVGTLAPLSTNTSLSVVIADGNQLTSLDGLENKSNLTALLFEGNQITDISAIEGGISQLQYIDLGNNQVSDIGVLAGMGSGLGKYDECFLILENNQITDESVVPADRNWAVVSFYGNPLQDISHIANMDNINCWTYLPYVEGTDYAKIEKGSIVYMISIVDAPYDSQAKILRDMGADQGSSSAPAFITGDEADAQMVEYRSRVISAVNGEPVEQYVNNEGESE